MLRKALPEDLVFVFDLYMHPEINPWLLYEPMDMAAFEPIYHKLLLEGVKYIFAVDDQDVGMVKLIPNQFRTSHVLYIGGLAVHPSFAGKGYGRRLIREITGKARGENFRRLELSVATINRKAIRVYEQEGFVQEGVLRQYTFMKEQNRYVDEALMALLL
jgi:L-phenylalanine/L-methionine N-acetyltransferase